MNSRAVAVAAMCVVSGIALHGRVPTGELNPLAGALAAPAALAIGVVVVSIAVLVAIRPAGSAKGLVVIGVCLVLVAEFVVLSLPEHGVAAALPGIAVGLVLVGMCRQLRIAPGRTGGDDEPDDAGESLQRWVSRTESLIAWSQSSRTDWDRRVRPILARQFEMATKVNQRRLTDAAAFQSTGRMLFGDDLWYWVDPDNVARGGTREPGPGRQRLEAILHCLEQV